MTTNPLILKLQHAGNLTDADIGKLEEISAPRRHVAAKEDIIREGAEPTDVHLVLDGIACRYKMLPDGKRSIAALKIAGDFCDLHAAILGRMDDAVGTLTPCTIVDLPRATIDDLTHNHPRITQALWWATLVDKSILREWLVSMGKRSADRQVAHFFCELLLRHQAVNRATENSFGFPLTQEEMGDILGLSAVHVNRVMQQLKESGLIRQSGRTIIIPNVAALKDYAAFNPNYLHLKDHVAPAPGAPKPTP
ncbi:MAG: Crp/Fnr family transcriptional regulator [Alphaproteobacteria bacterium]|nr:Crp/Fnr family transcriptional regulator [Alphaproteobacteria bacterium]MBV9420908.1 Crp/Fnr family transcriptional regulator [Alphaproteobacteria bacterium]MBV9539959.1 Crp/Fnr family transcriptional regulator [Alphaproteobacteria bacterium]MBV9905164.1 Crp/Fnr family transcriptional regulator [Alphaproteobacteria bacterium]